MYRLYKDNITNQVCAVNQSVNDVEYSIPIAPDNTDYANFKAQILTDEATLQDADSNTMTAEEAKQFIATLP